MILSRLHLPLLVISHIGKPQFEYLIVNHLIICFIDRSALEISNKIVCFDALVYRGQTSTPEGVRPPGRPFQQNPDLSLNH